MSKEISWIDNGSTTTDETQEQELARNIKKCTTILNELLESCAQKNISVKLTLVSKNHSKQNEKIKVESITKNLL